MKNSTVILCILLCFFSCKKDSLNKSCSSSNLFKQVKFGNRSMQELTYNGNCSLYESIELSMYQKYHYDEQNRLVKIDVAQLYNPTGCYLRPDSDNVKYNDPRKAKITAYSTFEYDSTGRLSKQSSYFTDNISQVSSYRIYEYENNHIVKIVYKKPNSQTNEYSTYEYDTNDNVIKVNFFYAENGSEPKLEYSNVYRYDNKNNPFIIFAGECDPGIFTNKNNIISQTFTIYSEGSESSETYQTTYEYNNLDYPIKCNGRDYIYSE
jgi:hypothetical protein